MSQSSSADEWSGATDEKRAMLEVSEAFFLHFFTNLNLTGAAAEVLAPTGFSLTRNRILGFATLTPGITVGELVRSMRVTHQNLNEPMRRLITEGFLTVRIGEEDRRQKRLFATAKGNRLYRKVLSAQLQHLRKAFLAAGPEATKGFLEVQRHLIDAIDKEWISRAALAAVSLVTGDT